jgi:hypothetical protein
MVIGMSQSIFLPSWISLFICLTLFSPFCFFRYEWSLPLVLPAAASSYHDVHLMSRPRPDFLSRIRGRPVTTRRRLPQLPADGWSKDDAEQDKRSNEKEGADRLGEQYPWVPRNIISVRRRFSSTIGTQMKPSTSGTGPHSNLTQMTPIIPNSTTGRTSNGQFDRLYTPILRLTGIHASVQKGLTFEEYIYNSG